MITVLVAAIGALLFGGVTVAFWDHVRNIVSAWLRRHGLDKSVLMSAVVRFDRRAVGLRRRIRLVTGRRRKERHVHVVSEEIVAPEDIDPQLRDLLTRSRRVEIDIMQQI